MKKHILFIGILLIAALLLIYIEIVDGVMSMQPFVYEDSMLGLSIDELQCQWDSLDPICSTERASINMLRPWYSQWVRNNEYLIVVSQRNIISDYLIFDTDCHLLKGSISPDLSLKKTLSQIAANNEIHIACDVGSGVTINTTLTCDGYIVAWTSDKETIVYDARTFGQKNVYFIYRLIHGMLW